MGIQSVITGQTAGQSHFDFSEAAAPRARGRGATTSPASRYSTERRSFVDDGWYQAPWRSDEGNDALPSDERRVPTELLVDSSRTIISRNKSPDVPFDRSINPYKGCEHGCTYCFARPTHAFLDMSPGLDFETRIFHKPNAAALLADELHKPGYRCDVIAMGTNTDPYQPVERDAGLTRAILEVLRDHNHPVSIVTKSDLVLRDLDILGPMAARGQAKVMLSITTLDRELARKMEPRASTPAKRLKAIRHLTDAGVPSGVLAAPMIPGLNDTELEDILEAAAKAGAIYAGYIMLRLPLEVKEIFFDWLQKTYPNRARKVMNLLRQSRNGRLNDSRFGARMRGNGLFAELLGRRFDRAVARLDFNRHVWQPDIAAFKAPVREGDQLRLL